MLEQFHGMPTGAFSADECFGGREPTRGVELCTIVETAFSLNAMTRIQGDARFADRAERIGYNALPGGLTEDMCVRLRCRRRCCAAQGSSPFRVAFRRCFLSCRT